MRKLYRVTFYDPFTKGNKTFAYRGYTRAQVNEQAVKDHPDLERRVTNLITDKDVYADPTIAGRLNPDD